MKCDLKNKENYYTDSQRSYHIVKDEVRMKKIKGLTLFLVWIIYMVILVFKIMDKAIPTVCNILLIISTLIFLVLVVADYMRGRRNRR
jgi:hypothetical protein